MSRTTTNTATRDPLAGILLACGLAVFFFLAVAMPACWLAGNSFLNNTNTNVLTFYSALFLHTEQFKSWLLALPFLQAADVFFRISAATIFSIAAAWYIVKDQITPKKTEIIEGGEVVEKNTNKMIQKTKKQMGKADGIFIHPEIQIPKSRESEHIFIGGSTGAGKSQTLSWMIDSILARKDKALIFDIKGDYTSQLISEDATTRRKDKRFLVAPWDKRSIQWNIAKDITTEIDADAFAAAFIPLTGKESNPYFTQAAQDVLSGILIYFQKRCGEEWGWKDLSQTLADPKIIHACLTETKHAAAQHIQLTDGSPSPQTQGVLGSIRAPLKSLDTIANYWSENTGIGIVNSFLNDKVKGITLVLAARPDMTQIATPLISGLLALMMRKGLSLPDSKTRRVHIVLDECGALPKITALLDAITLSRSKGLCFVIGTQDLGRLESVYGKEQVQTISSQFGTHLIGRLGDSSTAKWAAELFGQQRIERLQISENQAQSYTGGLSYQPAVSTTWQQADKAALLDSDFLHLPKATGGGFFMYARLTDDDGNALLGKIKYPINPVPSPFPACIEKAGSGSSAGSGSGSAGGTAGGTAQQHNEPEQHAQTEEDSLEELEAIIQSNDPEPVQEQEQGEGEGEGEEMVEKGVEEIGLHALGIDGGLNTIIDVAEELIGNGGSQESGSTSQQTHSTNKKRKRRLKKALIAAVEI